MGIKKKRESYDATIAGMRELIEQLRVLDVRVGYVIDIELDRLEEKIERVLL